MTATVSELLHEAAEVQRLCDELLALPVPLDASLQEYTKMIVTASERFSRLVTEPTDIFETIDKRIWAVDYPLRSFVTCMCGYASIMRDDQWVSTTELQHDYTSRLEVSVFKLSELVFDMLKNAPPSASWWGDQS